MATYLFGDEEGLEVARRVDRKFARIPGLEGLELLESAARRAAGRMQASPAAL